MQNITSNEELMLSNIAQFESVNIEYLESIRAVKIFEVYRKFTIDIIDAPRAMNCKAGSRQGASEVLIRNY